MKYAKIITLVIIFILMIATVFTQPTQAKWPEWPNENSFYKHVVYKEIRGVNFGAEYRFIIETDSGYVEQFFYVTEDYRLDSCEPGISVTAKKIYVKECPYPPCSIIDSIPQYKAVYVYSRIRIGNPPILWYKIGYSATGYYDKKDIKGFVEAKELKDISASSNFVARPTGVIMSDTLYITKKTFLKLRPLEGEESFVKLKHGEEIDLLGSEGWPEESIWLLIQINGNIGWVKATETNYDWKCDY